MSFLLIMNPGSRSGKGKLLWETWESGLRAADADYECVHTERLGHARELARAAKADVVVAVGGDGTINEVLDGAIQSGRSDLRMGVLYSGTSPDFCRFHGIPLEPKKAVEALLSGRVRAVDVARITYHDAQNAEQVAHFGCSCNIGMGASIARFANKWRRYLGDVPGTGSGLICTIARNLRVDLDLELNGSVRHLSAVNNLSVAKNPYIASGLKLRLPLDSDDGKLYLVGIHGRGRLGILKLLPGFYDGSVTDASGVFVEECNSVCIYSKSVQEIEFDGDPRGYLPARIEILPKALKLIGGTDERV
jgi:diacylglycerol kinase family enzyme